jgi:hypothetical protein
MFVVFHTEFPHQDKRYFKTKAGAKRSATCSNRNADKFVYNFVEESWFELKYGPVGTKVVKNLMTGKDVVIAADTPWCCNPASETYWSM